MKLMWETDEKLKSKGPHCQSLRVDMKRGDRLGKRKGHQSTPPDCLRGPEREIDLAVRASRRQVREWNEDSPRYSTMISDKCHISCSHF